MITSFSNIIFTFCILRLECTMNCVSVTFVLSSVTVPFKSFARHSTRSQILAIALGSTSYIRLNLELLLMETFKMLSVLSIMT